MSEKWEIRLTKQAKKDVESLTPKLKQKVYKILTESIGKNPQAGKKLLGDLAGSYSYAYTYKDRIVYSLDEGNKIIFIERARTHYGD